MHLTRLSLRGFRSWRALELELPPGLILLAGPNASGKTNLIEACYLLASLRSTRAATEGELLSWPENSADAPPPGPRVLRVAGAAQADAGEIEVEVAIAAREGLAKDGSPLTSKRIRVNGVPKRASEALGAIRAVQFSTLDAELLTGPASVRRRYLDLAIAQVDRAHAANLSQYQRALTQRNALLRRIARSEARAAELEQWDELLCGHGAPVWEARAAAAQRLASLATARHADLGEHAEDDAPLAATHLPGLPNSAPPEAGQGWRRALAEALTQSRARDLARGHTGAGPHRDDLRITLDIAGSPRDAGRFGSRAQQRSAALALRLAEADYLEERAGDPPILLLDDLFSELDQPRRNRTAAILAPREQVILTTPDQSAIPKSLPQPSLSLLTTEI